MRLIHGLDENKFVLGENIIHFFQSTEFQNWSISNHDKKIHQEWKSYKYVAKQYIYDFHKDYQYYINKEKEPSLKEVIVNKNSKVNLLRLPSNLFNKVRSTVSNFK